jgi:hypothetical protein
MVMFKTRVGNSASLGQEGGISRQGRQSYTEFLALTYVDPLPLNFE